MKEFLLTCQVKHFKSNDRNAQRLKHVFLLYSANLQRYKCVMSNIFFICLQTRNTDREKRARWINCELVNIHLLSLPLKVIVQRKLWVISQTPAKTIAGMCEVWENKGLLRSDLYKVAVFDGNTRERLQFIKMFNTGMVTIRKAVQLRNPVDLLQLGEWKSSSFFLWCLLS